MDNLEQVEEKLSLSITEMLEPTNENLDIIFTPEPDVISYTYTIIKDRKTIAIESIDTNRPVTISLNESGTYTIRIRTFNLDNVFENIISGEYHIDKEAPVIELNDALVTMQIGDTLDITSGVTAIDNFDGDITNLITTNYDSIDFTTVGLKRLVYTVVDSSGNEAHRSVNINVKQDNTAGILIVQFIIIALLILIIRSLAKYRRSNKIEARLTKYSIEPVFDHRISFTDNVIKIYTYFMYNIEHLLSKSALMKKFGERYDKYIKIFDHIHETGLDFIASKLSIASLFLILTVFTKTIHSEQMNLLDTVLPTIFGYYLLDIIYYIKFQLHRHKIENDLLQAIIIMNNAFKSGHSIVQAIKLVSEQLTGSIADEFKKINLELSFGLSIESSFKRFSERIDVEEVRYLTSSLIILNRTGGNIVKVFTSVEKTLMNRKRLKLELNSLTGASKMLVYIMFAVPLMFVLVVSVIDTSYFRVLFTTTPGIILTVIIIIVYAIYIFFVRKTMKVTV